MSKHVLYVLYDGLTENIPQSQVIPYLVELSKKGYRFTILSFEKENYLQERKTLIQELLNAHNIAWVIKSFSTKPPIVSKLWNVWQMKQEIKKIHSKDPISLIHCRSYMASLSGLWAKQTLGIKFLFDMRGFWADENKDMGVWNLQNVLFKRVYSYFKQKEKDFLEQSDAIVSLTTSGKKELLTWKNISIPENKINVIPCCVDTSVFDYNKINSADVSALRKSLNIDENALVICFLGTVGNLYMPDKMMRFFSLLLVEKPNSIFLYITTQPAEFIYSLAKENNIPLDNIRVKGAKRLEVASMLSICDYSLFFIRPYYSKIASSPTKQGEIMALGIPIITNKGIGDTEAIVRTSNAGYVVEGFTDNELLKCVKEVCANHTFSKEEIRNGATQFYSLNNGVEKYNAIYRELIG